MPLQAFYAQKSDDYFGTVGQTVLRLLRTDASSAVLELGCGSGATGAAALGSGKAGRYVGIELNAKAAASARARLTEVIEDDVEALELGSMRNSFDALIISEVLEHLTDPWCVLSKLAECVRPGGQVIASSPNVSHWRVIRSLLAGRFDYAEAGVMDRTHLRWFTPTSYRQMFEAAGLDVVSARPITPNSFRTRLFNRVTGQRLQHLFMVQILIEGRRPETNGAALEKPA